MALVTVESLTAKGPNSVVAGFTGTATAHVNGLQIGSGTATVLLPFPSDEAIALELHDTTAATAYSHEPELYPVSRWRAVSAAARYRIYHTPPGGSEAVINEVIADSELEFYAVRSTTGCGEGWHRFRVTALNAAGVESDGLLNDWIRIRDIPELPSDMEISGSSGTFTITLTE